MFFKFIIITLFFWRVRFSMGIWFSLTTSLRTQTKPGDSRKYACVRNLLYYCPVNHLMMSKSGKKKKSGKRGVAECVSYVLTTFWRLLWAITEQTHGNMESICFI